MKNLLLLKSMSLFLFFFIGIQYTSSQQAQAYKYLRLTVDQLDDNNGSITNPNVKIDKIRWIMGDTEFPLTDLHSYIDNTDSKESENDEIYFKSSFRNFGDPPYKVFEDDDYATFFSKQIIENGIVVGNNLPVTFTLEFKKAPIYPTGILLSVIHGTVANFHCEGSNDGSNWTLLYTSPTLGYNDFIGPERDFSAGFGSSVPAGLDVQAPSTPSGLTVSNTTAVATDLNWNAATDNGVGFLFYEIYVNGALWQTSSSNAATVYGLSKNSSYNIQVKAVDAYNNKSVSNTSSINTGGTYPEAIRKIDIGTGVGLSYKINNAAGIFKSSTSNIFAGNWQSTNPADGPFAQSFIDEIKKFSHIRFMDMVGTNFNKMENWGDRIQADSPNQRVPYHGTYEIINNDVMAYEWAIYLCNVTNRNMWINVPAEANENFVRQLAILIKNNLNPNLKIYLENSNETWNPGFPAFSAYKTKGAALGFGNVNDNSTSHKYMVYKTVRIFEWFKDEFNTEEHRITTVLAGQLGSTSVSTNHLAALKDITVYPNNVQINPNNTMPDFYGLAPYFDLKGIESEDGFTRMTQSIDEKIAITQQHFNIWQAENIALTTYEGGIHMNNGLRSTYSLDKGVYNTYLYYLDQLAPYYAVFTHYSYVFGADRGNNFGAVDYVGQPSSETPKARALLDWIDANKNNTAGGNAPPLIFQNPEDITVPNGVTEVSFSIAALAPVQSYKWYKNNTIINGAISNQYVTERISLSDNGTQYKADAINSFGSNQSAAATLTVTNHHLDISKTSSAPIIDGTIDNLWGNISSQEIANANKGTTSGNTDLSGNFKITWDANKVYLLVQVTDDVKVKDATGTNPEKYNFDGIEIYFNDDNAYTDTYNNDAQYVYNWEGSIHAFSGNKPTAGINVAQTNTTNGYILELAIPWSNIAVSAQNGNFLGFDIMINDNDVQGSSQANEKKSWHTLINDSWKDPREFASVKLTDGTQPGTAPTITSQPSNVSVNAGSNASFSVTASGSGLSYQWFKDATAISGAINNNFTINSVTTADAGDYHVVVTNAEGSVTSSIATLSINSNPGSGYRYLKITLTDYNNLKLLEADWLNNSGSVPAVALTSNNSSGVIVTEGNFSVYDDSYTSATGQWIGSGTAPNSITIDLGSSSASPNAIKLHKWSWAAINAFRAEGSNDGTSWDLLLSETNANGAFSASSVGSGVTEATFNFSTSSTAPTITSQPSNVTVGPGSNATFSVTATGNGLTYQWFKDATAIGGATNNNFTINSVTTADAGDYHVVVANAEGSVSSITAILTVTGYRYLKFTVNDYNNFSIREIDWVTANGFVPSSAMTSNNSSGAIASNTEGWSNAYTVFDEIYDNNGYWIGNGTTPKYVTIDLGSNSVAPTAIKIYKSGWATLNGFKAEGTNNLSGSWDLLLSETNANGAFTTSSTAANVVEATFAFNSTAAKANNTKVDLDDIKVFPNPVIRFLKINVPTNVNGKLMMSLTSITGKLIFRKELRPNDNISQIDFSRLASGLYLLEFRDNQNVSQHKIIKQ